MSLFLFYIFPNKHFFDLKFSNDIGLFFRAQFLILTDGMGWYGMDGSLFFSTFFLSEMFISRVAGAIVMLPYGVPFEPLNIYIFPNKHFFDLKFLKEIGLFFRSRFFILTDGWTGGRSTFFFGLIS